MLLTYSNTTDNSFLRKRRRSSAPLKREKTIKTWDKDIVCLPHTYNGTGGIGGITIPRGKRHAELGRQGLIGKIRLSSDMTEEEIMREIHSVFAKQMKNDMEFPFTFLQCTGGGAKTLTPAQVSPSWTWTAQQVVSLGGQGSIYILANVEVNM